MNLDSPSSLSLAATLSFLFLSTRKATPCGPLPKISPEFKSNPRIFECGREKDKPVFLKVIQMVLLLLLLEENKPAFIREKFSILKCWVYFVVLTNKSTAKPFVYWSQWEFCHVASLGPGFPCNCDSWQVWLVLQWRKKRVPETTASKSWSCKYFSIWVTSLLP